MSLTQRTRPEGLRRLYELMQRVNSGADLDEVLDEIARGVVEVLGFGVAAISRLEGDTLVMTNVAAPEEARAQIMGKRTPVASVVSEFSLADEWGVLRFLPHDRLPAPLEEAAWIPEFEPSGEPGAWHPLDTLYAPLWSATGRLLGNMSVDLPPGNRVPEREDRELLEMFVVQAGLAMDNAQQRERLAAQVRMGEMLQAVSSASRLSELEPTLRDATAAISGFLGVQDVWIRCFVDGDFGDVEHSQIYPADQETVPELVEMASRLAVQAWATGRPALIDSTLMSGSHDVSRPDIALVRERAPFDVGRHILLAPVGVDREVLGYLIVVRDTPTAWSSDEEAAVMEVGRTLGRAVLNARLYERERHLVTELKELDTYKGELIATISHELKTPLTSIIGHVELLEDATGPSKSVEAIARNAHRLNRLVQNLLNYSSVEEARTRVRESVDLVALAQASLELVSLQAETGEVTVTLTTPTTPVLVQADGTEIATVVDNLVSNGVKYTRAGGSVTIEVGTDCDEAYVSCADTGLGISPADQKLLFSSFHRSSNPEALSIPGTGLGLAISRRIVNLHGGQIIVSSELGRGSTFRLQLPLDQAHTG